MAVPSGPGPDKFHPLPVTGLYRWIQSGLKNGNVLGIPAALIFRPSEKDSFRTERFGKTLETPIGPAAGPHTQLAQNIVAAWLTGARYIELKTIQDLDSIEVAKPCIDIRDEGYNCEWSQELNIDQSFSEYLKAWALLHLMKDKLGVGDPREAGFIFNMSAGYDLKGIRGKKVTGFLNRMRNAGEFLDRIVDELSPLCPELRNVRIPRSISDNITVSTMHGTPPEEIEKIGRYFLEEAGLHTVIKLNPTLPGPEKVREIVNARLGFETEIPDSAFEHDIRYSDALDLVRTLGELAEKAGLFFGIKLTNTLECINPGDIFPSSEKMAYMSGRALHPLALETAAMFREDLGETIDISFSAGADAFNISQLVSCGLTPVTVCSDILKPGGYGRLRQYLTNLEEQSPLKKVNVRNYAEKALNSGKYNKTGFRKKETKTTRELALFDCIQAPCTDACGTSQDVPQYLRLTAEGKYSEAFRTVYRTNSFPNTTGMVCDHQCQIKCTRSNYDNPLQIREVKRFLAENYGESQSEIDSGKKKNVSAAIVGAGPSGLTCARHLAEAGFGVTLIDREPGTGGMVGKVIPEFRLGRDALEKDTARIMNHPSISYQTKNVGPAELKHLIRRHDYVYISSGAPRSIRLEIRGIGSPGVIDPLEFLAAVKAGKRVEIGKRIAVIGGGNTAMDSARTALRMAGEGGEVTILYRRTKREMPADPAEVISAMEEGIELMELITPESVITGEDGETRGLRCLRTELGEPDSKGRRYPVIIEGSELDLSFDTVIPAVGQRTEPALFDKGVLNLKREGRLLRDGKVLVGGDAGPGDATLVNAVGDGRAAAEAIIRESGMAGDQKKEEIRTTRPANELRIQKAFRQFGAPLKELSPKKRLKEGPVILSMTEVEARQEARRCLMCDELCDICVTVCPNRANISTTCAPLRIRVPVYNKQGKAAVRQGTEIFEIRQPHQVLNITDLCNHCGNCTTFCPTAGEPYLKKPRFALSEESFNHDDNVFRILQEKGEKKIFYKLNSRLEYLYLKNDRVHYDSDSLNLSFTLEEEEVTDIWITRDLGGIPDFRHYMTLLFLLDNVPEMLIPQPAL